MSDVMTNTRRLLAENEALKAAVAGDGPGSNEEYSVVGNDYLAALCTTRDRLTQENERLRAANTILRAKPAPDGTMGELTDWINEILFYNGRLVKYLRSIEDIDEDGAKLLSHANDWPFPLADEPMLPPGG